MLLIALLDIKSPHTTLRAGLEAIDWYGILGVTGATVILLVGLQLGGTEYPWSSATFICLIIFGSLTLVVFGIIEARLARNLLIPLHFFTKRSRVATLSVNVSQSIITAGAKFFLPLYYQLVLGVFPLMSGVYLLPFALTISPAFHLVGYMIKGTGKYLGLIRSGAGALVVGSAILIASQPSTSWPLIVIPQIFLGVRQGLAYQAPLIAFQAQTEQKDVAAATSTYRFLKSFSQMVSIVIGQVIFQNQVQRRSSSLAQLSLPPGLAQQLVAGTVAIQGLQPGQQAVVHEVLVAALNDMWIFYTVAAVLGLMASTAISKTKLAS